MQTNNTEMKSKEKTKQKNPKPQSIIFKVWLMLYDSLQIC